MKPSLPRWLLKRFNPTFLQALIEAQGCDDDVLEDEVSSVLFWTRFNRVIERYLGISCLAIIAKLRGANQAPSPIANWGRVKTEKENDRTIKSNDQSDNTAG